MTSTHPSEVDQLDLAELVLDRLWNYGFDGQTNIVELDIPSLGKKINAGRPPTIHTVRGFGYVIKPATPGR